MKKLAIIASIFALAAAPAIAETVTLTFSTPDGDLLVTLDSDTSTYSTSTGDTGTYTYDEATKTLCGDGNCITFEEVKQEVGFTTNFTGDDGTTGTVTVTSIE